MTYHQSNLGAVIKVRLRTNALGRWILVYGNDDAVDAYAWSGSKFVAITRHGIGIEAQVANLATKQEARKYAETFSFKVQKED